MKARLAEIRMLHIALNSNFWHWRDMWYLLTGRA
jgi:hypothetical protein